MANKSDNSATTPRVYKETEFADFIDFIKQGLWRNGKLLSELCSVDEDTITAWKKQPAAIAARKLSMTDTLKTFKNRGDVEKRLKEQGMEFDPDKVEAKVIIEVSNLNDV